jgi:uncharacterized protein YjbI with pentapeptide repeats
VKVFQPPHLLLATAPSQLPGGRVLDVTVRAVSTLRSSAVVRDAVNWPDAAFLDVGSRKFRAEWLALGSAFAPPGQRVTELGVRVRVGGASKALAVFGERAWQGDTASPPVPFSEVPVDWEHAYGGKDFAPNPVGKGAGDDADGVCMLPNVEDPRALVRAPSDAPAPAGFAPIPADAPARAKKLGTYDDAWLEHEWPGYARDLDPTFFNVAAADQWLGEGEFFVGDEEIRVDGMHAEHARVDGRLPGLAARCFVNQAVDGEMRFQEVKLRLETLVLLPNIDRVVLLYRGAHAVKDDEGADIKHVLAALERLAEPRSVDHYRAAFEKRLVPGAMLRMKDDDLLPTSIRETTRAAEEPTPELELLLATDRLMAKNIRRRTELELERARSRLLEQGIDPDAHGVPKELPPPIDELDDEEADTFFANAEKELQTQREQAEAHMQTELERVRAVCAEHGVDLDAVRAENDRKNGGPPRFDPAEILERLDATATLIRNAGVPDDDNGALVKLNDPVLKADLTELKGRMIESYRQLAHYCPAAAALDGDEANEVRRRVEDDLQAGISFADRDLTGANLAGMDLSGRNFQRAFLEKADLRGAVLDAADFSGAVLARADLTGVRAGGARFAGANLGSACLSGAGLKGADLRGAVLVDVDLTHTDLCGANLEQADLGEAKLSRANLDGANLSRAQFGGGATDGVTFRGAVLAGATFQDLDLSGVDFGGANLEKADFLGCAGRGASFRNANMVNTRFCHLERGPSAFDEADFSDACLRHANLRGVGLRRATFVRADLSDADFSGADCEEANFHLAIAERSAWVRANLRRARLEDVNLRESLLKSAVLSGANLMGANLFAANLLFVRVDGSTSIQDAELGHAIYREERAK